ncbi:MAG TPA: tryptophan-rich sensory protein [Ktedonobacteraceae bacterium]|nr:tryptophan-rich sensory protein [Ktedonobacteraceae bacterium]
MNVSPPRWRWYHAVAFYVVVQIMTFGLSGLVSVARGNRGRSLREAIFGDVSYFRQLNQVKITPPSWAFGPAWFVNNVSVFWGIWQVLNKPRATPGRTAYLALQGASWIDFILFNACTGYLGHPFKKETLLNFHRLPLSGDQMVLRHRRRREMVLMHKSKQASIGSRSSGMVCTDFLRELQ